jgi:hypothetical protein
LKGERALPQEFALEEASKKDASFWYFADLEAGTRRIRHPVFVLPASLWSSESGAAMLTEEGCREE